MHRSTCKDLSDQINSLTYRARFPQERKNNAAARCRRIVVRDYSNHGRMRICRRLISLIRETAVPIGRTAPRAREGRLYVYSRTDEGTDGGERGREAELFPLAVLLHLMAN